MKKLVFATLVIGVTALWIIAQQSGRESQPVTVIIVAPDPTITLHSPTTVTAGGPEFTLLVNGTGFLTSSVVRWDGQERPTTYVSATELQAQIPATDIAVAGTAQVTVFTPETGPSVDLGWDESPTVSVVGYNAYRSEQNGGPYSRVNGPVIANLNYSDNSARQGTTYFYVVRAVDSEAIESVNSNQAAAIVP